MILSTILAQAATAAADSLALTPESMQAAVASLSSLTIAEVVEYVTNAALSLGS